MSKSLFTIRESDARIMKFNGASWSLMGGTTPISANGYNKAKCLFSFRGNLYSFTTYNDGVADPTWQVHLLDTVNDTYTLVATLPIPMLYPATPASAFDVGCTTHAMNYRDAVYLLVTGANQVYSPYENYEYALKFDGATLTNNNFNVSAYSSTTPIPYPGRSYGCIPGVVTPHDDKLVCLPKGIKNLQSGSNATSLRYFSLDYSDGITSGVSLINMSSPSGYYFLNPVSDTYTSFNRVTQAILTKKVTVGGGSFNSKLYMMTIEGIVQEVDFFSGVRTPMFDIRDFPERQFNFTPSLVKDDSIDTYKYNMRISSAEQTTINFESLVGSRITYTNRNSANPPITGSQTSQGVIISYNDPGYFGPSSVGFQIIGSDGNDSFPIPNLVSAGDTFRIDVGAGAIVGNAGLGNWGASGFCFMQEACGHLYIFIPGRSSRNTARNQRFSHMIKWDGTPNPGPDNITFFNLTIAGEPLDCWGADCYFDPTNSYWHFMYYDENLQSVSHIAWDCVNDAFKAYGGVFTMAKNNGYALGNGTLIGFVPDQRGATIQSAMFDAQNQKMVVNYTLYSQDGSPVDIEVAYNDTLNPWTSATRFEGAGEGTTGLSSSISGDQHVFVHDTYFDMGYLDGSIQYKITTL
jgi:hypothetical protein